MKITKPHKAPSLETRSLLMHNNMVNNESPDIENINLCTKVLYYILEEILQHGRKLVPWLSFGKRIVDILSLPETYRIYTLLREETYI